MEESLKPKHTILSTKISWPIVSNAFCRSIKIIPVNTTFQILDGSYHSRRTGKYLLNDVREYRIGVYITFSFHRGTFVLDRE